MNGCRAVASLNGKPVPCLVEYDGSPADHVHSNGEFGLVWIGHGEAVRATQIMGSVQRLWNALKSVLPQQDPEPDEEPDDEDEPDLMETDYVTSHVNIERRISDEGDQVWVSVEPRGQVSMVEALGLLEMAKDTVLRGGVIPGSQICVMEDAPDDDMDWPE